MHYSRPKPLSEWSSMDRNAPSIDTRLLDDTLDRFGRVEVR